jgi:hypothetical protein
MRREIYDGLHDQRTGLISGARRDKLEGKIGSVKCSCFPNLRTVECRNHVPRYLFRAWGERSGGGSTISINTPTLIVPHGFVPELCEKPAIQDFYNTPEDVLARSVYHHVFEENDGPGTLFSTWFSSLHLVLCYASVMPTEERPHVAVLDRLSPNHEVLVWQAPDLIGHENFAMQYLAYGRITGPGYTAVSLHDLNQHGLKSIFPELRPSILGVINLREEMFKDSPSPAKWDELQAIGAIASLFGKLAPPVAVALATLRPRPKLTWEGIEDWQPCPEKIKDEMKKDAVHLQIHTLPDDLFDQCWLQPGMVDTEDFEDVEQWIRLMLVLSQTELPPRIGSTAESSSDDDGTTSEE